jgi:hypothetical protein
MPGHRIRPSIPPLSGELVSTSRKLEEIASSLDDMSMTLEEIKDNVGSDVPAAGKLDEVQAEMEKATDLIEESLNRKDG